MHVRAARHEDAEQACDVVKRSITELCEADHRGDALTLAQWLSNKTPDNMRRWIDQHCTFVATDGAAIVGVAVLKHTGEIILNYVSPDARFRGVSKALIARLEARARELGIETLTLQSSATAIRFYFAAGYRSLGPPTPGFGVTFCHPMAKGFRAVDGASGAAPDPLFPLAERLG
jgi:GNAT superfamily N-acetyltransferase